MQYPGKDLYDEHMDYQEFSTLLHGILPNTPLGEIVQIRAEENPEVLKNFNDSQRKIRDDWRSHQINEMTEEEKQEQILQLQDIFSKAFS